MIYTKSLYNMLYKQIEIVPQYHIINYLEMYYCTNKNYFVFNY